MGGLKPAQSPWLIYAELFWPSCDAMRKALASQLSFLLGDRAVLRIALAGRQVGGQIAPAAPQGFGLV
jgi:hypothetical protein